MSGMPLETCWAFNERWNNKFYYKVASCWLFLLSHTTMHGSMNIKVVLIQLILLMMSTWVLETCRDLEQTYKKKELCVGLVMYKNYTEMLGQQNVKFHVYCFHHQHHHWLNSPSRAKAFCRTLHLHLAAFSTIVTLFSTPSTHLRWGLSCGSHASWSGIENPSLMEVIGLHIQHVVYVSVIYDYINMCMIWTNVTQKFSFTGFECTSVYFNYCLIF